MIPLITSAVQLKSLTLRHPGYSDVDAFFTQLACAPQLPALSELKFAGCNRVAPATLLRFIARFQATLESLWIENVTVAEGKIGDVLNQLATLDLPALRCVTVADCFRVFFCPLIFKQPVMEQCGDGFEFTLRSSRRKSRVNGVRYRGHGDDIRLALSALGDSSYKLQSGGSEPDTPDMYFPAGMQTGRVVREFA
ncbi:hypothetical protein PG994_003949 [Apiospora phragmitis]|uniref:Uncharacterized protein n=1 Tax=Apiospora phragmitis TaxID=2905665 RepID=A0ABR1VZN3_9PEZI